MGNCANKPKVLKDSDEAPAPAPAPAPVPRPVEAAASEQQKEDEAAAAAAQAQRRNEKGKEIMVEGGEDEEEEQLGDKRRSLSHLFKEDELRETMGREIKTEPEPMNQEIIKNQTGPSSDAPKPEDSVLEVSEVKVPEVSTEPKTSGTIPAQQTPQTPDFVDAQGTAEPEAIFEVAMPTDKHQNNKEIVSPETNNAKETVFVETENERQDVSSDKEQAKENALPELRTKEVTEEKKTDAENPEVAK